MDNAIACSTMDAPSASARLRDEGSMLAMNSGQRICMDPSVFTLRNQTSITIKINVFYAFRENLS
jgi:hypothetical protein